jgi:hypothetical protein
MSLSIFKAHEAGQTWYVTPKRSSSSHGTQDLTTSVDKLRFDKLNSAVGI